MAQQGHRGPYPNMSLAVVGEYLQEKNRVGMEVQSLQVVMVENRKEELRKGRHQTSDDGANEEQTEGAPLAFREGRAGLEHLRPVDALRRHHLAHLGKACLRHIWRAKADENQAPAGAWRGAMSG